MGIKQEETMLIDLNQILIEAAKTGNMVILKAALGKGADINAKR